MLLRLSILPLYGDVLSYLAGGHWCADLGLSAMYASSSFVFFLSCLHLLALRYGVLAGPLLRSCNRAVLVLLPVLGHIGGQGVVWVGGAQ